ncbi:MAG: SUMF1/EgtB/PvdO family nonheme iron enzyme [Myxococcales bacterium]|nr:SUMF1/EgtB/PvdO family nonheme iron enzyme [Myxococcales bacterium]
MPEQPDHTITPQWSPPKSFEEFRLLWPLSRGGMGEVYLGHDTLLDRPVAVKFISTPVNSPALREQFMNEARAAARLQHPNVVTIYRVGEVDEHPVIISEFVRGQNLDALPKPVPWTRAVEIGLGLARGLAAAHRRGVLHRDIKPGNVIISNDGEVKLLDFGLAEFFDADGQGADPEDLMWSQAAEMASVSGQYATVNMAVEDAARLMAVDPPPLAGKPGDPDSTEFVVVVNRKAVDPSSSTPEQRAVHQSSQKVSPISVRNMPSAAQRFMTIPPSDSEPGPRSKVNPSASTPEAKDEPRMPLADLAAFQLTPRPSGGKHQSRIAGTPLYMAPEIWRGEPVTRETDIYAMGALLYELCAGAPPHIEVPLTELPRIASEQDAPPLLRVAPTVDPRFAEIVDRCLKRDSTKRFASGDDLREALEALRPREGKISAPEGNPYRGLLAFEAEHRSLFFGRTNEIGTIIDRLRTEAFVLVAADSGVGKSSLCRAGVLPLVTDGALGNGRTWSVMLMVPGRNPLLTLCELLAPIMATPADKLMEKLRNEPTSLAWELRKKLGDKTGVLIFIDQLEELVTIGDQPEVQTVGAALGRLCSRTPGIRMLATVRSDFLARVATVPSLGDELARALYILRPMTGDKMREAIVGPAHAKGVRFETAAMVDQLTESTAKTDSGLPLLQFALTELWDARKGDVITEESLAKVGGVTGALARHADQVLMSLPADQRMAARRILMMLVTLDGTRARRTQDEILINPPAHSAAEALVKGRLIVARDTGEALAYEVAHEALIRGWDTLKHWLEEFAESRQVKGRLEQAASEWHRLGKTREALWSERQLAELTLIEDNDITTREQAFISASRGAAQRSRIVKRAIFITVPVLLGMIWGGIKIESARNQRQKVNTYLERGQSIFAEAKKKAAEAATLRQRAYAAFDGLDKEKGESVWALAIDAGDEASALYSKAEFALSAGLAIDSARTDVRDSLSDVLYEMAQLFEATHQKQKIGDVLSRLQVYDERGQRIDKLMAPATLDLAISPAGAEVEIGRYVLNKRRRYSLTDVRNVGVTPLSQITLQPASYLITIRAPGHQPVRYPLLVSTGEKLRLDFRLPKEGTIPSGFVYIPPGRFLFGSGAEEVVRSGLLTTVPLHEIRTAGYIINRHETTFTDVLEFLSSLSTEQRAQLPILTNETFEVFLKEIPSRGWSLRLKTGPETVQAGPDEPLIYPGRKQRSKQVWVKLPWSGINVNDSELFANWLNKSGRLPGARLCTEYEWERAARGADDRIYPHGNDIDATEANFDETYGQVGTNAGPDEVGTYPQSESPFGVFDMSGNVHEWTVSSVSKNGFLIRGGSNWNPRMMTNITNRGEIDPKHRYGQIGLRICASFDPK